MKTTSIDVLMDSAEGALVRLLGVIGRRGYQVAMMQAQQSECGASTRVQMEVTGDRPASFLIAQIEKLYDVRTVRAAEAAPVVSASPRRVAVA